MLRLKQRLCGLKIRDCVVKAMLTCCDVETYFHCDDKDQYLAPNSPIKNKTSAFVVFFHSDYNFFIKNINSEFITALLFIETNLCAFCESSVMNWTFYCPKFL